MSEVKGVRELLDGARALLEVIEREVPQVGLLDLDISEWKRDHAEWVRWADSPPINEEAPR